MPLDTLTPRVGRLEERVGGVETSVALLDQRLDSLHAGQRESTAEIQASLVQMATEQRADARELARQQREESRWWWGRVFALLAGLISVASGGGLAAWYGGAAAAERPTHPVEVVAPTD